MKNIIGLYILFFNSLKNSSMILNGNCMLLNLQLSVTLIRNNEISNALQNCFSSKLIIQQNNNFQDVVSLNNKYNDVTIYLSNILSCWSEAEKPVSSKETNFTRFHGQKEIVAKIRRSPALSIFQDEKDEKRREKSRVGSFHSNRSN